ncbi:hypothetical protein [Streptomyces sp. TLI_171]|uniref:hypothetical protein n=1 Tax=Streptomyces sp. TLI_171 TaxID=1938859 RepID=UPI000C18C1C7|nr:hypothetical protein [Streptomyces sp. TLI_171]RKE23305.1 hypothetical protein BX266_6769 [Streptomyces sp. TLI_171]
MHTTEPTAARKRPGWAWLLASLPLSAWGGWALSALAFRPCGDTDGMDGFRLAYATVLAAVLTALQLPLDFALTPCH